MQSRRLVERHLLPRIGHLSVKAITRSDMRAAISKIGSPSVANQALAAASSVFSWAVRQEVVAVSPCTHIEKHKAHSRDRIVSESEAPVLWQALDSVDPVQAAALRVIWLTGVRPGECVRMRIEHVKGGWWELPGKPDPHVGWLGTKNARAHKVWLSEPVREIVADLCDGRAAGFVFANPRGKPVRLDGVMKTVCTEVNIAGITAHDLRRSFGSTVTKLGYGRAAMDRVLNHADGGVGAIYDRYTYEGEDQAIWDHVAAHVLCLAEGRHSDARRRGKNFNRDQLN